MDEQYERGWQMKLYYLQQEAPKPLAILCSYSQGHINRDKTNEILYGKVYHGDISRQETIAILQDEDSGAYLVRDSSSGPDTVTLVIKFDDEIKNFRLFYNHERKEHYVGESFFKTLEDLVADGLIHFYVETRGADVIAKLGNPTDYDQSPYVQERERYYTLQCRRRRLNKTVNTGLCPQETTLSIVADLGSHPSPRPHLPYSAQNILPTLVNSTTTATVGTTTTITNNTNQNEKEISPKKEKDYKRRELKSSDVSRLSGVFELNSRNEGDNSTAINSNHRISYPSTDKKSHEPLQDPNKSTSKGVLSLFQEDNVIIEKAHNYKQVTFVGPQWCDVCAHFMWGLVSQGVRCQDCGMQAHKKCGDNAHHDCIPDMKLMKRVFGVELSSLVLAEHGSVPQVLIKLITEVENRGGLKLEGIYRECGMFDHIEELKMMLNKDVQQADFSRFEDVNIFAGLIKKFFHLLPIPLLTFDLYDEFIVLGEMSNSDVKLSKFDELLQRLPKSHLPTVVYLFRHLKNVADNSQHNRMDSINLGRVFSQSILRKPSAPTGKNSVLSTLTSSNMNDLLRGVGLENAVVQYIIENYDNLFLFNFSSA